MKKIEFHGHPGLFITLEGPEGAGKSTQAAALRRRFTELGYDVVPTREPGGTPLAEQLRSILKHFNGAEMLRDETELLLMEAARSQHVGEVIRPALRAGKVVICDRFTDSTLAYQGGARGLPLDEIRLLNRIAVRECVPDLTLLLDLPPEDGMKRAVLRAGAAADRFEQAGAEFHARVRAAFLAIASQEPDRIKVIAADAPVETVTASVGTVIDELL